MVGARPRKTRPDEVLGRLLIEARQRRNIRLEAAASALNIPLRQLQALEEGDFSVFAAEIYARGACMKYASYLGIANEISERAVWRAVSAARQMVPLRLHTTLTFFQRLLHPKAVLVAVLGSIALLIGGYIAWQVESFLHLPELTLETPADALHYESVLVVKGFSEPQTKVTLNDKPVILKPDNSFEIDLVLHPGINVVRAEAENAAGRKRSIERHILLTKPENISG